ncbi:YceI family protein [Mucilaginibacter sp.]|jgi:polyisoprenoid-binding protein YceI|uniref:YceI family protein n=1 Tax=Mucilaginibacter sp. TaxID=1882438 RepID=UPI002D08A1FE|nr:YceI family protein [Mucilaginibacter sp.]HTI58705.1 YceI family protein [Mucilaginibacter sp.]
MKKLLLFAVMLLLQIALFAQTTRWKNDKMHSKLRFSVVHHLLSDVDGLFKNFDVTITTTKPDFSDAVFELSADVSSINTEVEMRDNDLRSANFFDAAKYPTIIFKSSSIKADGANKYKLTGNLTMHGVTKPVTMDLWYRGTKENPNSKKNDAGFKLRGTLKRSDFNIGSGTPNVLVSDEVEIEADGEFAKAD